MSGTMTSNRYRTSEDGPMISANQPAAERVAAATAQAEEAFWTALATAFPEARSGDLAPSDVVAWEQARDAVIAAWLANNAPAAVVDGA
jgi:hypothetical protein